MGKVPVKHRTRYKASNEKNNDEPTPRYSKPFVWKPEGANRKNKTDTYLGLALFQDFSALTILPKRQAPSGQSVPQASSAPPFALALQSACNGLVVPPPPTRGGRQSGRAGASKKGAPPAPHGPCRRRCLLPADAESPRPPHPDSYPLHAYLKEREREKERYLSPSERDAEAPTIPRSNGEGKRWQERLQEQTRSRERVLPHPTPSQVPFLRAPGPSSYSVTVYCSRRWRSLFSNPVARLWREMDREPVYSNSVERHRGGR
ncbi:uncharacterized protein LOC121010869 [Herpailurus yagouaroundi]|uniref:uncharacterized protein LOC121010869 n=1 Tax=Herpailurus yagouaroundi TaxID=1608482 RepID=UPI001AD6E9A7|nr:uncharacterized protein LOC121010869 [Puma yagouaroundi]